MFFKFLEGCHFIVMKLEMWGKFIFDISISDYFAALHFYSHKSSRKFVRIL